MVQVEGILASGWDEVVMVNAMTALGSSTVDIWKLLQGSPWLELTLRPATAREKQQLGIDWPTATNTAQEGSRVFNEIHRGRVDSNFSEDLSPNFLSPIPSF